MAFLKPSGITGLNTSHPLYSKINGFWEIGQLDKELISDTSITYAATPTYNNDADLGDCRLFQAGANSFPTNFVPGNSGTLIVVWKLNNNLSASERPRIVDRNASGHIFQMGANTFSTVNSYQIIYRGGFGTTITETYDPGFASNAAFQLAHAFGARWNNANGTGTTYDGNTVDSNANSTNSYSQTTQLTMCDNADLDGYISAIVSLDELTDAELESITTDGNFQALYATGGAGFTLTPEAGTFTYSGGSVELAASRVLIPETANFNYSGGAVELSKSFNLTLEPGSFSYAGGGVELTADRVLTPESGSFLYSGGNVGILAQRQLTPETGSFSYAGGVVEITFSGATGFTLSLEPGVFAYTGGDVQLTASRSLSPESGAFSYSGGTLQITADRFLTPETGTFDYLGGEIGLIADRNLIPESGVYTYSGGAVTISYSGQVIRRVSTYSVNYEQDYITGGYADDDVTGSYQGIN